jgi:hypothetical protein
MTELLMDAARRMGVPTDVSAGPENGPRGLSIWARWPRHPHEVAQDVLNQVTRTDGAASVTPLGGTPLWRARRGEWTHIGRFEEAVAQLALHCSERPRLRRAAHGRAAAEPFGR